MFKLICVLLQLNREGEAEKNNKGEVKRKKDTGSNSHVGLFDLWGKSTF